MAGMAKRNTGKAGNRAGAKAAPGLEGLSASDISDIELETMRKVNATMSALEAAMARWDASPEKPEGMKPKFARYKLVHEVLARWQTKALRGQGSKAGMEERVMLLWEFVDICRTYL